MNIPIAAIILLSALALPFQLVIAQEAPANAAVVSTKARMENPSCVLQEYPLEARMKEQQGTIEVAITVGADGMLVKIDILKSTGSPSLDRASLRGIRSCKVIPATLNGEPVEGVITTNMVWSLG